MTSSIETLDSMVKMCLSISMEIYFKLKTKSKFQWKIYYSRFYYFIDPLSLLGFLSKKNYYRQWMRRILHFYVHK